MHSSLGKSGKGFKPPQQLGNDAGMMLEMQLKMAKRAELSERNLLGRSAEERKATAEQQKQLVRKSMLKKVDSQAGLGVKMAEGAASGALFAQKRAARQSTAGAARQSMRQSCKAGPGGAMAGLIDPRKRGLPPGAFQHGA